MHFDVGGAEFELTAEVTPRTADKVMRTMLEVKRAAYRGLPVPLPREQAS